MSERNFSLEWEPAFWNGHKSVRLAFDGGYGIGLATTTYSYQLSEDDKREAARRLAALWNLHRGESTEELEAAVERKRREPSHD